MGRRRVLTSQHEFIPLSFQRLSSDEQSIRVDQFNQTLRSEPAFTREPVDLAVVREAVRTAGAAPSGANFQPWQYVVITDPAIKRAVRQASEREAVARLATLPAAWQAAADLDLSFLEEAPSLIAVFRVNYGILPSGKRIKHYYVHESTGLSISFLLAALRHAGVSTHLHAPAAELGSILKRPRNETPVALVAIGGGGSREAARAFYERMRTRRVIREFSDEPVPAALVQNVLAAAEAAPTPAGLKTWRFELISDPALRRQIRELAEQEERLFYETRITPEWREALAPLGTDWEKPFLEVAPHLIACFKVDPPLDLYQAPPQVDSFLRGSKLEFTMESAAIASGFVIGALHHAGLACLTHTPSPMAFLRKALGRPANEAPFLLLPVGYPAEGCRVPNITKKPLEQILTIS